MARIIFSTFVVALLATVSATPQGFPFGGYASHYGFVAGGPFGVAKVDVAQNPHSYNYLVNEHGPHYKKYIHQTADFHHGIPVGFPVAVPYGPGIHVPGPGIPFPGHVFRPLPFPY